MHKRDPTSVFYELFIYLTVSLSTRRHYDENVKKFESRFSAHLSRFSAHVTGGIPESLVELMLLSNSAMGVNKRM